MDFEEEVPIEEVDLPPELQLAIDSTLSNDSFSSLPNLQGRESKASAAIQQSHGDSLSASSSSLDSLNMLLERQRMRQLNHPHHQEFINVPQGVGVVPSVKETNEIFLKYDPVSKRKVLNTYEIINELGHGQHGKVKLARDLLTKQLVAIKIVDRHEKKGQKFFRIKKSNSLTQNDKIKREIAIMKKCHYKHVVKLIEVLDDLKSRKIYLVLEYCARGEVKWCPGDQLETAARGPPLLSFQRTREILRGVVLGLEYLHYQGVIHRDIKPANLLISEDGTVKISDFGVSLAASGANRSEENDESIDELELAKTAGTPAFFAPEICLGNDAFEKYKMSRDDLFKGSSISFMIDIWALGVTLYCLLFGMLPFISDYELELFEKIVNDPVTFPDYEKVKSNRISRVSCEEEYQMAKDIVGRLLEKNPLKRITIPEIKEHPFVCWDFYHVQNIDGNSLNLKLDELKKFQLNKEEHFKQISISKHELKNAVLGVGKKIKESVFKALPMKQHAGKQDKDLEVQNTGADHEEHSSAENCSDSSFIVSEGSIMSNLGRLNLEYDNNNDKHEQKLNDIDKELNGAIPFKQGYNMCNDNDDNDKCNKITREVSQKEIFEKELQKFDEKHDPKSIVSLPINSSFASLDSFYIDNFAMSKVGSNFENSSTNNNTNRESKAAPSIFARPPHVGGTYQPFATNRNAPTAPNFLKRSSSRLDFLNMGMQSTRNDRIPQNRSKVFLQRSGKSSTDIGNKNISSHPKATGIPQVANVALEKKQSGCLGQSISKSTNNESDSHSKLRDSADRSKDEKYQIKRGNFFNNFNGQDEDTSHSSETSSCGSSYSSSSESESEESAAESLPFEFAVDSANASVVSMRDVSGLEQVRPFIRLQTSRNPSRKGSVSLNQTSDFDVENSGSGDSDGSNDSNELILTLGKANRQRRQGSSQTSGSSNDSSRRNTIFRENEIFPSADRSLAATPGSITTLTQNQSYSGFQKGSNSKGEDGGDTALSSDTVSSLPRNISSCGGGLQRYAPLSSMSSNSSDRALMIPGIMMKPTTHVDDILSTGQHTEQFQDNSRDLLKTVLKSTAGGFSRRQSVPYLSAVPESGNSERLRHYSGQRLGVEGRSFSKTHLGSREPRKLSRHVYESDKIRSQSISIAQLGKKKR